MKKKIQSLIIIVFSILVFFNIKSTSNLIKETCILWFNKIIPTIPISYFLGNIILNSNQILYFPFKIINKITKFENFNSFTIFIVSIIVGNPTSTILISNSVNDNLISIDEGNKLLTFSSFISIFFIFFVFEFKYSLLLFISQVLASLVILFYINREKNNINYKEEKIDNFANITILIQNLPYVLLNILSTMIFTTIIKSIFKIKNKILLTILSFLEITTGINYILSTYTGLKLIIISSLLLSFHGIAILLQSLINIKIRMLYFKRYLKYRIIHALLASIFSILIYLFFIFII